MPRPSLGFFILTVVLTAVYFGAGKLGLSLAVVNESASAVWPPTGLAVAMLLLVGSRVWPAIFVGAFLVNVTTSGIVGSSLAIAAGNTLEGLAAAWLARRFAGGVAAFDRTGDILRFTLLSALLATTIAACAGVVTLVTAGLAAPADVSSIWLTWWLGDATGTMLVAPLILLWSRPSTVEWTGDGRAEAIALAIVVVLTSMVVFWTSGPVGQAYPLQFLIMPVLLWSAFRFGSRETATAAAVTSAIAIEGTLRGLGPFARGTPNDSLLILQSFIGVTTTVMLIVAAEVATRRAAERKLLALNDTLERHVAERTEELTQTHHRLLEAQQVAHVGSWEWNVATNTLWWSDEMCAIYGVEGSAPSGYEGYLSNVHPDDRAFVDAAVRQAAADGQPFRFEHRIVRRDGSERVMHSEGRVVLGADGRPVRMMGIGHDITDRKQAEAERAQLRREHDARRQAEEANRSKDRFLATLSHELRTPLNAAIGWAQMMRELPAGDPRADRAAEAIYRNLLVQSRLVSDIMDVTTIAAGTLRLQPAPVQLSSIVETALEMVQPAATARGVSIDVDLHAADGPLVGDRARLQQVLWNLLANAVRFSGDGSRIDVRARRVGDILEIVVADNGPGIDPAFLPHVFEQFRQADDSVTREHGGLGLGLAIARHIVELHGGSIAAANCQSGGAQFTVRLPLAG